MAIRFRTDSTADILPQEAAQRDIDVVPLKVLFGETAYRDGIDLDHPTFYQMLSQYKALPTTSPVSYTHLTGRCGWCWGSSPGRW